MDKLKMSNVENLKLNNFLEKIKKQEIILFGASSRGRRVLNNLIEKGVEKKHLRFCDNDSQKWDREICGVRVISINELETRAKDICIIISSSLNYEINDQLNKLGFSNVHYFHLLLFKEDMYEKYDSKFLKILDDTRDTCYMDSEEKYTLYSSMKAVYSLPGDVAEVGVYKGGSAKIICETKGNKKLYLFDTFEGYPDTDKEDLLQKGWLSNTSLENVKKYLDQYGNIDFFKGLFPQTAESLSGQKFCFVHLDVDNYQAVKAALEFFWPRMIDNGRIVSHDYNATDVPGVRKAFSEFFFNMPEKLIEIADTQVLIIK